MPRKRSVTKTVAVASLEQRDRRREGFAKPDEVCHFLNLSRAMLQKMLAAGEIPCRRYGSAVRIPWTWLFEQVEKANVNGN